MLFIGLVIAGAVEFAYVKPVVSLRRISGVVEVVDVGSVAVCVEFGCESDVLLFGVGGSGAFDDFARNILPRVGIFLACFLSPPAPP